MAKRKVARNSLKGYNYQNYIFTLFLAKMDTERNIVKIESEALDTKQFDDIYIEMNDETVYRIHEKLSRDSNKRYCYNKSHCKY